MFTIKRPGKGKPSRSHPAHAVHWIWMTCCQDRLEHAVTDDEMATVIRSGTGIYPAICGHEVIPLALTSPPGHRCARCVQRQHPEPARIPAQRRRWRSPRRPDPTPPRPA
jgi:hypothetical protein